MRELVLRLSLFAACCLLVAPAAGAQQQPGVDLNIWDVSSLEPVDPGGTFSYSFLVNTSPPVEVRNVVLRVVLPPGVKFVSGSGPRDAAGDIWTCSEEGGVVLCAASRFLPDQGPNFFNEAGLLQVIAPSSNPEGAALTAKATINSDAPDPDPNNNNTNLTRKVFRDYFVTSAENSGPGSLRETLQHADDECDRDGVPCHILFRIPPPVDRTGWYTIDLASPLPPITPTYLLLDGASQTAFTGDTNSAGPEIQLSGHRLEQGNGLEIRGASDLSQVVNISGLVINGFPENGILFADGQSCSGSCSVTKCYIGTDPTGTMAVPNRLRGVSSFSGDYASLTITSNVLSGNGRSGIFLAAGTPVIENNRIGVKAAADEPLPNGKSGIYFGSGSNFGCVDQNVIAYNAEFGIALERQAYWVWIARNSIKANSLYGLDIGLDLASPESEGPVLTSARYDDATGVTTIAGLVPPSFAYVGGALDLYSNVAAEPNGEGETWLGSLQIADSPADDEFAFAFKGDLVGKTITATATQLGPRGLGVRVAPLERTNSSFDSCQQFPYQHTSEFGPPLLVTR